MKLPTTYRTEDIPQPSYEPVPTGWHTVVIDEAEYVESKSTQGAFMLRLRMTILSEPCKDRKLFDRLNLENPSEKAVEIAVENLGKIGMCLGIEEISDTDQLLEGILQVKVGHETYQDSVQERIRDYGPEESFVRPTEKDRAKNAPTRKPETNAETKADRLRRELAEAEAEAEGGNVEPAKGTERPWKRK